MSKQENILKLLKAGKVIRVIDGRCGDGFVDKQALTALIAQDKVKLYTRQGFTFVKAKPVTKTG